MKKQFDRVQYVNIDYSIETGQPMILVKLEEDAPAISQAAFDIFVAYIKEEIKLEHAHILVDGWLGEMSFNAEF